MKISKKTYFAFLSASLVTSISATDVYQAPDLKMRNVEPVKTSKTLTLDEKFKVEKAVEEGRRLASEEELVAAEQREPSSIQKPVEEIDQKAEAPKFWNLKKKDSQY